MSRPVAPDQAGRGRLPVPARDRRPALAALALLLVVAGALGSALVVYRSGQRVDVLVAAHQIAAGQQVSPADFTTARVSTDSHGVVRAADVHNYDKSYATTTIPAGTLINRQMFQVQTVLPRDGVVVGVSVAPALRPAGRVIPGDVVRAYYVPKAAQGNANAGQVIAPAARVVDVQGGSAQDAVTVSLLVSQGIASPLVAAAAQGNVAIAVLPVGTKPDIDFQSGQ